MPTLFWLSCAVVLYVYVGYPLLLHAWGRLRAKSLTVNGAAEPPPAVSIVIAARNEAGRIAGRIANLNALDYPRGRVQIVVVSDGSTDETTVALAQLAADDDRIVPVEVSAGGKALALNAGIARAANDVIVFADMRQGFAPDALRALVAPFRDPRVGAVTGELVLDGEERDRRAEERRARLERRAIEDRRGVRRQTEGQRKGKRRWSLRRAMLESTITDGVGLYWRYEKQIRRDESAAGSVVGATGAIYAMRRSLWRPLPADTILDDVLAPMRCVMAGFRVVFEERARAFDRTASDSHAEGRRKLRTLAGNYQLLWLEPALLLPWRNPAWVQFVSHKAGRLVVPYALPVIFVSSLLLARDAFVYAAALAAQCAFYALAAYGSWLEKTPARATAAPPAPVVRLARVALMFLVMNKSAVAGLVALVTRQRVWR